MDVLTSSEFRKRYATLTTATQVTVNGHVIGEWVPITASPLSPGETKVLAHSRWANASEREELLDVYRETGEMPPKSLRLRDRYDARPFTPVPKPAPRKKR